VSAAQPRRWRVLHLITRLERGGSSDCTLWQAIGAARRGHEVTVASGPTDAPSPLVALASREPGLSFVTVTELSRAIRPWNDARALLSIWSLLRRRRFDIIHLHTSKAGALGRLAALAAGARRRVIHQPHGHLFYGYYGRLASRVVVAAERTLAPLARLHITLTDAGTGEHLEHGIGRPHQYRTLPSGVDFRPLRAAARRREECRRRLGFGPDDIVVGTLCRLEAIKGPDVVTAAYLEAAADRPGLRLVVGGDGPMRGVLASEVERAGAGGRVRMPEGWIPADELLPACDIFVLASRNEGMGRALVEAMALGLPVIGSAVGGVGDLLDQGRAGLLVAPGDRAALARAIARLADDRPFAWTLGRAGRARAVAYGAGRMVHGLLRLYQQVAA
jgi:glycosyltransferase involved in cell wall biosynthesis